MGSGLLPPNLTHGLEVLLVVLAQDLADGGGCHAWVSGEERAQKTRYCEQSKALCVRWDSMESAKRAVYLVKLLEERLVVKRLGRRTATIAAAAAALVEVGATRLVVVAPCRLVDKRFVGWATYRGAAGVRTEAGVWDLVHRIGGAAFTGICVRGYRVFAG